MSVTKGEEIKSRTKFILYHNVKQKKFKNKEIPKYEFKINKQPSQISCVSEASANDEDNLVMSVYELNDNKINDDNEEQSEPKLIGEYDMNIKPDQKSKDIEIDDKDGNKILFKIRKGKRPPFKKSAS
jgi:hypothetical protein